MIGAILRPCFLPEGAKPVSLHQSVFERSMPSDLIRGWKPVRVKKTHQNKRPELGSDSIKT
jgi:hypothetical protein